MVKGDEQALTELMAEDEIDDSDMTKQEKQELEKLLNEYNTAMSYNRNKGMLEAAAERLESGETVFYAVGLAHLLDTQNGFVKDLREAGYTVELVEYK